MLLKACGGGDLHRYFNDMFVVTDVEFGAMGITAVWQVKHCSPTICESGGGGGRRRGGPAVVHRRK
jgi:hypothetical protein